MKIILLTIAALILSPALVAQENEQENDQFNLNNDFDNQFESQQFDLESNNADSSPTTENVVEKTTNQEVDDFPDISDNENSGLDETESLEAALDEQAPVVAPQAPSPARAAVSEPPLADLPEDTPIDTVPEVDSGYDGTAEVIDEDTQIGAPVPSDDQAPIPEEVVEVNNFSGVPFFPGSRRMMAVGEAPESYKVEEGDTLFDICDQLLDESDYWPKLWALNPNIKNPHFIYPGMNLTFYPGSDEAPPFMEVVSEDEMVPVNLPAAIAEAELNDKVLVGGNIDRLLLENQTQVENVQDVEGGYIAAAEIAGTAEMDDIGAVDDFEEMNQIYKPERSESTLPAFFVQDSMEDYGDVIRGALGSHHAGRDEQVIVDTDEELQVGSTYTIVREQPIKEAGEFSGYRYDFVAHAVAESTLESGDQVLRTRVSYRGVRPGDLIVDYKSTRIFYKEGATMPTSAAVDASIIGFDEHWQHMAGQRGLVFIDQGLTPGSVYPIYQNYGQRMPGMLGVSMPDMTQKIGTVQIIKSLGGASIGVVMYATLDVRLGDALGKG